MNGHVLVLGGARSGKTAFGEKLALMGGEHPVYLATGQAGDREMATRIARHRQNRDKRFLTREAPLDLIETLGKIPVGSGPILIDCLTLWLSNLMAGDYNIEGEVARLVAHLGEHSHPQIIMVSNEVGLGIVPENALARRFRDEAGVAHQKLAAACETVIFVAAGLPLALKGRLPEPT
ncbi:MAG: bifunctional adenosylcobinamide kinase/adenosylcobinamide-phosphate guanylyltransferase [Alphaproteobacteria bacterium]|nr:bifunctional adenosylcobinamide kinase/adenosylcobinamide-phosphate guanylyltransferase [Alphaproteobacteria bacterium]